MHRSALAILASSAASVVLAFATVAPAQDSAAVASLPSAAPPAEAPPAAPPAAPARAGRASLAVIPFQGEGSIAANYSADLDLLYDSLVRLVVKTNKFDVLERTQIDSVISENHFATTSLGDPANLAQFGKLSGAQYLLVGTIRDIGVRTHREPIPYTSEYKCTESARLRLEVRVVQTKTGRIVAAESAGDSSDPAVRTVSCARSRGVLLDETMNRVAAGLVSAIVDGIYPLTVIHVSGEELTLNRGEGSNFSVGSQFDCAVQGEAIIDPATGEALGNDETPAGKIQITKILDKLSKAKAEVAGAVPLGATCRRAAAPPAPKAARHAAGPKVPW